jgi:hypothetical protein
MRSNGEYTVMERLLRIFLVVEMYVAEISAVSAAPILTLTDGPEAAYSDLLSSLHTQLEAASIASMDEIIVLDNVAGQSIAEVEARIHEIAGLRPEGILLALGPAAYEYAHEMIIRGKFPPARCIAVLYAVSAHELPPTSVGRRIVVQVPVSRDRSLIASDFGLDSLTLLVDDTAADWQVAGLEDMPVVRFDPNQPGTAHTHRRPATVTAVPFTLSAGNRRILGRRSGGSLPGRVGQLCAGFGPGNCP